MKRIITLVALFSISLCILTACGKTSEDKLQGKWKADNSEAMHGIGSTMKIDGNKVKVSGANETPVKYYNFKDKDSDEEKHIRFYTDKPNSKIYDKDYPDKEGVLHFKNDNYIEIETEMDGVYKFKKE